VVDLFLYDGEGSPGDVRLRDPSAPSGGPDTALAGLVPGPDWSFAGVAPSAPLAGVVPGVDWTGVGSLAAPRAGFIGALDFAGPASVAPGSPAGGFSPGVDWTGMPGAVPLVQYAGLRGRYGGITYDLALVDAALALAGSALFLRKNGVVYAVHLVELAHPHASPFRVQTPGGPKALRLLTS